MQHIGEFSILFFEYIEKIILVVKNKVDKAVMQTNFHFCRKVIVVIFFKCFFFSIIPTTMKKKTFLSLS